MIITEESTLVYIKALNQDIVEYPIKGINHNMSWFIKTDAKLANTLEVNLGYLVAFIPGKEFDGPDSVVNRPVTVNQMASEKERDDAFKKSEEDLVELYHKYLRKS